MSIPNYTKSFKNISVLYTTSRDSCLLAFDFIKLLTKKFGKGYLSQIRYINLRIEYSINMFASKYVVSVSMILNQSMYPRILLDHTKYVLC